MLVMADLSKIGKAAIAISEYISRNTKQGGSTTPGESGKNVFIQRDKSLANPQTLDKIGEPVLPPRPETPMKALETQMNEFSQPTPLTNRLDNPFNEQKAFESRGIYGDQPIPTTENTIYTPPTQPVLNQFNAVKKYQGPVRPPYGMELVDDQFKAIEADVKQLGNERYIQSGNPKSNAQLDTEERMSRTQNATPTDTQSGLGSGSEELSVGFRKKAKSTNDIQDQKARRRAEFTVEQRDGRKQSDATNRYAIDRRGLTDKEAITNRLKARAAGQVEKYNPAEQYSPRASGDDFNAINDKMQEEVAKYAAIARKDPGVVEALSKQNYLNYNDRTLNSISLDLYHDMYPGALPKHIARDIEHFRMDKSGAKGPPAFDIESGKRNPVPEIEDDVFNRTKLEDSQAGELEATFNDVKSRTDIGKGPPEPSTSAPQLTTGQMMDALKGKGSMPTIEEAAGELGLTIEEALNQLGFKGKKKNRIIPPPTTKALKERLGK